MGAAWWAKCSVTFFNQQGERVWGETDELLTSVRLESRTQRKIIGFGG
ncbi:Uncharacterised protein [Pantoea agglomerans]|uniref:Uncharacterized protein n=1 Tax=Enterobacter agglomerans TaxID=549 RepID=A0A379ADT4_ENTAG|nr:Uncharacterised protein [Pantoea agglomerans]